MHCITIVSHFLKSHVFDKIKTKTIKWTIHGVDNIGQDGRGFRYIQIISTGIGVDQGGGIITYDCIPVKAPH
jgi:hypothetical protein